MDKQLLVFMLIGFALLGFLVMNNTPENKQVDKGREYDVIFIKIRSEYKKLNIRYIDWLRGRHGNPFDKDKKGGEQIYDDLRQLEQALHYDNDQYQNENSGNAHPLFPSLANDIAGAMQQVSKSVRTAVSEHPNQLPMAKLSLDKGTRPQTVHTGVVNNYFGAYTGAVTTTTDASVRTTTDASVRTDARTDARRNIKVDAQRKYLDQSVGPQTQVTTDARSLTDARRTGGIRHGDRTQVIGARTNVDARNQSQIGGTTMDSHNYTYSDGGRLAIGGDFLPEYGPVNATGYSAIDNKNKVKPITPGKIVDFGQLQNPWEDPPSANKPANPPPTTLLNTANQIPSNIPLTGLAASQTDGTLAILAPPTAAQKKNKPPAPPGIPKPKPMAQSFTSITSSKPVSQPVDNVHAGDISNGTSLISTDLDPEKEDALMTKVNQKKRVRSEAELPGRQVAPKKVKEKRSQMMLPALNVVETEPVSEGVQSIGTVVDRSNDNMPPPQNSGQAQQRRRGRKPNPSKTKATGRLDGYEKTLQGKAYQVEIIGKRIAGTESPSQADIKEFWKLYNDLAYTTPYQIEILDEKEKKVIAPPDNRFFVDIHKGKNLQYKEQFILDTKTIKTIQDFLNHYNSDFETIKTKSPEYAIWENVMKNLQVIRNEVPLT